MKKTVGKLFESRKGQMDDLLKRDFINNGIATFPIKISSYYDVIHPLSVRRYETLNPDFKDLVELGARVIPPDCPIVLNIIEDCLTRRREKPLSRLSRSIMPTIWAWWKKRRDGIPNAFSS